MNTIHPLLPDGTSDPYRFPCWLWSKNARQWFRCNAGAIYANTGGRELYTYWHADQPTAPTGTPYLAPRPPAPRDAEWAKRAAEEIHKSLQGFWVGRIESYPSVTAKIAEQIARHAPADEASAQRKELAAMREEWDAKHASLVCQTNRADNLQLELAKTKDALAAAQAEVGRLTKERDEARAAGVQYVMDVWLRCLGDQVYPKAHHIDALGKTTRRLTDDRNVAQTALTAANAELVEARKDRERIDWMAAQSRIDYCTSYWKKTDTRTLRQAVDDAMNWTAHQAARSQEGSK